MNTESYDIDVHPEVQAAANRLKKAYKKLKYAKTLEKHEDAKNNVMSELLSASIVTQYIENVQQRT